MLTKKQYHALVLILDLALENCLDPEECETQELFEQAVKQDEAISYCLELLNEYENNINNVIGA